MPVLRPSSCSTLRSPIMFTKWRVARWTRASVGNTKCFRSLRATPLFKTLLVTYHESNSGPQDACMRSPADIETCNKLAENQTQDSEQLQAIRKNLVNRRRATCDELNFLVVIGGAPTVGIRIRRASCEPHHHEIDGRESGTRSHPPCGQKPSPVSCANTKSRAWLKSIASNSGDAAQTHPLQVVRNGPLADRGRLV